MTTVLIGLIGPAGCNRKDDIQHYRVAKAPADDQSGMPTIPHMASGAAMTPPAGPAAPSPYTWTAPASWQPGKTSPMRIGSYTIAEGAQTADISIVLLQGTAGGVLANVNRWRGQVQLAPLTADQLAGQGETIESAVGDFTLFMMDGTNPDKGILAAILSQPDHVVFVKLIGPNTMLHTHKDEFVTFLKSIALAKDSS